MPNYHLVSCCFIGPRNSPRNKKFWNLLILSKNNLLESVIVSSGGSPHDDSFSGSAPEILSWKLKSVTSTGNIEEDPQPWFERCCNKSGCSWIVPLIRRKAADQSVSIAEIEAAYREHNGGKEMPKGTWGQLLK